MDKEGIQIQMKSLTVCIKEVAKIVYKAGVAMLTIILSENMGTYYGEL
jgi:hypothetical protein